MSLGEYLEQEKIEWTDELLTCLQEDLCQGSLSRGFLRGMYQRYVDENKNPIQDILVAVVDDWRSGCGKIVGWMTYRIVGFSKQWLELMSLCVSKYCARQGIAGKLITELFNIAKNLPSVKVIVVEDESNIPGFYAKFGFKKPSWMDDEILKKLLNIEFSKVEEYSKAGEFLRDLSSARLTSKLLYTTTPGKLIDLLPEKVKKAMLEYYEE